VGDRAWLTQGGDDRVESKSSGTNRCEPWVRAVSGGSGDDRVRDFGCEGVAEKGGWIRSDANGGGCAMMYAFSISSWPSPSGRMRCAVACGKIKKV
jgi:hypothetical protein